MPVKVTGRPSGHDRRRIAVIAVVSDSTVERVYAGRGSEHSRIRIAQTASQIGAPLPPAPSPEARDFTPTLEARR